MKIRTAIPGFLTLVVLAGCDSAPPGSATSLEIADDAVYQIAFVVDDLDAAMAAWTADYGIGPFFVARHFEFANPDYRGQALAPDVSLAFAFNGTTMIELIEQHDDISSVYREMTESRGYGFHHFAYLSRDVDRSVAAAEALGIECPFRADFAGGRLAYCDPGDAMGVNLVEYVQRSEGIEALLDTLYRAARDWDGSEPVRSLY